MKKIAFVATGIVALYGAYDYWKAIQSKQQRVSKLSGLFRYDPVWESKEVFETPTGETITARYLTDPKITLL